MSVDVNSAGEHRSPPGGRALFDGFPYIVTRIGRTPLRHVAVLPADWSRQHLVEVAQRQALANRLDTCLCFGPGDALFIAADGEEAVSGDLPWGVPVADRLELPVELPTSPELQARRAALALFVERHRSSGYLVGDGLEGGRRATTEDRERLSGQNENGIPRGLVRCTGCGSFKGDYLALGGEGSGDRSPRVVLVCCRCQNHNRCARCESRLAEQRLSAYYYDEAGKTVVYVAAYVALGHRCPDR